MTKCIQCIRDLFEYALYKFTLYFTYSHYQDLCKNLFCVLKNTATLVFYTDAVLLIINK